MVVEHLGDLGDGMASDVADEGGSLNVITGLQAIVLPRVRIPKVEGPVVFGAEHHNLRSDVGVLKVFTDVGVPKALVAKIPYRTNVGVVFQVDSNDAGSGSHKFVTLHYVDSENEDKCMSDALYEVGLVGQAHDGGVD